MLQHSCRLYMILLIYGSADVKFDSAVAGEYRNLKAIKDQSMLHIYSTWSLKYKDETLN